ncbi:unnamed protein product [Lactuca saligna]|uniref:DUF7851 domain-containing protein n=1 Tax=Lactuca saligna TaxID=75948 RepID=A0AA35ZNJ3_LACSI|nr:unnamed protein product [Lactuca saligna]
MEEKEHKKNKKKKQKHHHSNSDFSFKPSSHVKGLRFGGQFIVKSFTIRRARHLELLRLLSLPPITTHHKPSPTFLSTAAFLPSTFTIFSPPCLAHAHPRPRHQEVEGGPVRIRIGKHEGGGGPDVAGGDTVGGSEPEADQGSDRL